MQIKKQYIPFATVLCMRWYDCLKRPGSSQSIGDVLVHTEVEFPVNAVYGKSVSLQSSNFVDIVLKEVVNVNWFIHFSAPQSDLEGLSLANNAPGNCT